MTYHERRRAGQCTTCPRPALNGRAQCLECLEKAATARAKARAITRHYSNGEWVRVEWGPTDLDNPPLIDQLPGPREPGLVVSTPGGLKRTYGVQFEGFGVLQVYPHEMTKIEPPKGRGRHWK